MNAREEALNESLQPYHELGAIVMGSTTYQWILKHDTFANPKKPKPYGRISNPRASLRSVTLTKKADFYRLVNVTNRRI